MAKTLSIELEFWSDGSNWIALPDQCDEGSTLAEFAWNGLQVRNWCFFQTSGSEGRCKWVGLTKESMLVSARAVNAHFEITANDHWLLALPVHHVGGFGVFARAFLSGSRVTRLEQKWNAALFTQTCDDAGATLASLVPTQVFDLVASRLRAPESMRVVLVGGGSLSAEIEAAALALGWPVRRTYGMTETASQVASQNTEGGEMEILPIWDVSTDEAGVLTVRGEALAQGYAIQEEGGWRWEAVPAATGLRTRDQVEIWSAGGSRCLRFKSREAGIVKILGELVALRPIQERLDTLRLNLGLHAGEAVICDLPDPRTERRLVLAASQITEANASRLLDELNASLRPFEQVREVRMLPSLPRGELAKIQFAKLRTLLG
ncbi:MAG: AMP-binding protein [Prosthecobacter sp.]